MALPGAASASIWAAGGFVSDWPRAYLFAPPPPVLRTSRGGVAHEETESETRAEPGAEAGKLEEA